jgi:hypothetical protein
MELEESCNAPIRAETVVKLLKEIIQVNLKGPKKDKEQLLGLKEVLILSIDEIDRLLATKKIITEAKNVVAKNEGSKRKADSKAEKAIPAPKKMRNTGRKMGFNK